MDARMRFMKRSCLTFWLRASSPSSMARSGSLLEKTAVAPSSYRSAMIFQTMGLASTFCRSICSTSLLKSGNGSRNAFIFLNSKYRSTSSNVSWISGACTSLRKDLCGELKTSMRRNRKLTARPAMRSGIRTHKERTKGTNLIALLTS